MRDEVTGTNGWAVNKERLHVRRTRSPCKRFFSCRGTRVAGIEINAVARGCACKVRCPGAAPQYITFLLNCEVMR